jgi:putative zinc finger/helix-turn-helix YgiT family protein
MKWLQCGSAVTSKRENVPYKALPGTVLVGVSVSRCAHCGEYEIAIPAIDEINRALAQVVIRKPGRLSGAEVRFLRTYLGYSGVDFARLIHSDPASVSRWESDKQPIGHHTDLLLRAMVVLDKKTDEYPIALFATINGEGAKPARYAFKRSAARWRPTEVHAA